MKYECDFVVGSFTSQEKNLKAKYVSKFWGYVVPNIMKKIGKEIYLGPSTFAIKKSSFFQIGKFDDTFLVGEDVAFVAKSRKILKIIFDENLRSFT